MIMRYINLLYKFTFTLVSLPLLIWGTSPPLSPASTPVHMSIAAGLA